MTGQNFTVEQIVAGTKTSESSPIDRIVPPRTTKYSPVDQDIDNKFHASQDFIAYGLTSDYTVRYHDANTTAQNLYKMVDYSARRDFYLAMKGAESDGVIRMSEFDIPAYH